MATIVGTSMAEGQSTTRPPLFNGSNYNYWKARMMIYIQATDYDLWNMICVGFTMPSSNIGGIDIPKPVNEWSELEKRNVQLNAKAKHTLYCALDANEFNRISACDTAKEIWDKLEVTHEGTNQVKESKISMLVHKYELFKMSPDESISAMFTRFTDITNGLKSLGKSYTNVEMVRKILRCLPRSWQAKVTAIQEAKDLTKLSLDELLGSLMTHEITMKENDEDDNKRKKTIAFKARNQSDEDDELPSDEEVALLTRRFNKLMRKGKFGRRPPRRDHPKEEKKKDPIICFECKKPGHIKYDCPRLKDSKKGRRDDHNKKAMVAAWGESDVETSDEEASDDEKANLCLIADADVDIFHDSYDHFEEEPDYLCLMALNDDDNEVYHDSISFDELQSEFNELYDQSLKISIGNAKLRKQVVSLEKEIDCLKNEKNDLKEKNEDLLETLSKFTQGRDNLNKLLGAQKCVYDKAGIGYNTFNKQKVYKDIFSKPLATHTSPTTCHYCNKYGHSAYYCNARRNAQKGIKTVWVPKVANTSGPK